MGREPQEPELRFEEVHASGWDTREVVVGPPKPPRSKWWWTAIPVAVALVAVTHGGSGDTAAPTTTTTSSTTPSIARTTPSVLPSTTEVTDPIASTSTSSAAPGPALPFGRPSDLSLLIMSYGPNGSALEAYDIDTGRIHSVQSLAGVDEEMTTLVVTTATAYLSNNRTVVKLGSPPVRLLVSQGNCSFVSFEVRIIAEGPKGGVWLRETAEPARIVLLDAEGRSYVIRADGSHVVVGSGTTSYVRRGQYLETVCDASLACSLMARTGRAGQPAGGDRIGGADRLTTTVFDESGRHALVGTATGTSLVDLATKSTTYVGSGTPNIGGPFNTFAEFLPDDLGFVTISPRGDIELYDLAGGSRASIPVNRDNGGGQMLGLVSTALLPAA